MLPQDAQITLRSLTGCYRRRYHASYGRTQEQPRNHTASRRNDRIRNRHSKDGKQRLEIAIDPIVAEPLRGSTSSPLSKRQLL